MALLAYTFSLAGETTTRSQLFTALNKIGISKGELYQPLEMFLYHPLYPLRLILRHSSPLVSDGIW